MAEALREACASGNLKAVEFYILNGVNVDSQNKVNGFTPLHWANSRGHEDVIQFLIMNGAKKTIKDSKGRIPSELFNRTPFQGRSFVPNYIANPDLGKLWDVPIAQDNFSNMSIETSSAGKQGEKVEGNPTNDPTSASNSDNVSSFNHATLESESAPFEPSSSTFSASTILDQKEKAGLAEKWAATGTSFDPTVVGLKDGGNMNESNINTVQSDSSAYHDSKKISSKRSSIRKSVSFPDQQEPSSSLSGSFSQVPIAYMKSLTGQVQGSIKARHDEGEPSKTIDGSMRKSPSRLISQLQSSIQCDEKIPMTEVLVFKDFKSQISLKGSIFIAAETSLQTLYNQLIDEIDDMPSKFMIQKERDGFHIPINQSQLTQSAALHFKNAHLIYTADISRNI
jgi:hypothetical protein